MLSVAPKKDNPSRQEGTDFSPVLSSETAGEGLAYPGACMAWDSTSYQLLPPPLG